MSLSLHPRLSLNGIVTPSWTFAEDLEFCRSVGLRQTGLLASKVRGVGGDRVVEALKSHGLTLSSLVCPPFSLYEPARWHRERSEFHAMIDIAAQVGGTVYGPPGKGKFDNWKENARRYAEVVAPCVEYGARVGVTVAFEATLRPYLSFVHSLRDSLDLSEASGAHVVVDIGNCFSERDVRQSLSRLRGRIGIVQISDVDIGTHSRPGKCARGLPGEGELPIADFVRSAECNGYKGPFEIEFLGPQKADCEALKESLLWTSDLLHRAIQTAGEATPREAKRDENSL